MKNTVVMLALLLGGGIPALSLAAPASCRAAAPFFLRVQFAGDSPRDAMLESTAAGGLRLLDPATRKELWSAGSTATATQQIAGMTAPFGASLAAVHLDADGLHDRLYAGDLAGRLWRFDLRAAASPSAWVRAAVLADLGTPTHDRGFVAAPDITRLESAAGSWLNIAIGTANTGTQRAAQRFYVVRDALTGTAPAAPLTEADLEPLTLPVGISNSAARGYYLQLGSSQVLARSLTLDGRMYITTVERADNLLAGCTTGTIPTTAVSLSVTVLQAADGAVPVARSDRATPDPRQILSRAMPAYAGVELATTPDADKRLPCQIDGEPVPGCFLDTRPRRTWWLREDAD